MVLVYRPAVNKICFNIYKHILLIYCFVKCVNVSGFLSRPNAKIHVLNCLKNKRKTTDQNNNKKKKNLEYPHGYYLVILYVIRLTYADTTR